MGSALDWYKEAICRAEGHKHGPEGMTDCLLDRLSSLRTAPLPVKHA